MIVSPVTIALIIGIVMVLVGLALIVAGCICGWKARKQKRESQLQPPPVNIKTHIKVGCDVKTLNDALANAAEQFAKACQGEPQPSEEEMDAAVDVAEEGSMRPLDMPDLPDVVTITPPPVEEALQATETAQAPRPKLTQKEARDAANANRATVARLNAAAAYADWKKGGVTEAEVAAKHGYTVIRSMRRAFVRYGLTDGTYRA